MTEQIRDEEESSSKLIVHLQAFDGPLDLLLHLVRKKELDIQQLRLSELTEPYLEHIRQMQNLDLEIGGEFLEIASTLIYIKSRTLLPRQAADQEEEIDPLAQEEALLQRLRDYQVIKDAATELFSMDILGRDVFQHVPAKEETQREGQEAEPPLEPPTLFGLMEAYRKALERAKKPEPLNVIPPSESIEDKIDELLARFTAGAVVPFLDIFGESPTRGEVILVFMAVLELAKMRMLKLAQTQWLGEIVVLVAEDYDQRRDDAREKVLQGIEGKPDKPEAPLPLEQAMADGPGENGKGMADNVGEEET